MLRQNQKYNIGVHVVSFEDDHIPDFVHTIPMDRRLAVESLKQDLDLWTPSSPVMLDFPTGTGKNYFVTHVLVPQAVAVGKNVLILSNRVALSVQQKLSLMDANDPRRICLTPEGIRRLEDFGNVRVLTYQGLASFIKNSENEAWTRQLKYVIADEAHFFVADARFNPDCSYLLKLITSRFPHAIRVYLTATSWDVLPPLCKAEQNNYLDLRPYRDWEPPRSLIRYVIRPDYSGINLIFFTEYEAILDKIKSDSQTKWIIFVDSKVDGKWLKSSLSDKAQYIDAEKKGSDVWQQIVEKDKFDSQVLITTSVLDNGVNIRDDAVQNIVIVSDDRTNMIQSIGRKRRQPDDAINVWVRVHSKEQINKRCSRCKELVKWKEKFSGCSSLSARQDFLRTIWEQGDDELRKLFIPYRNDLLINELGFYSISRKIKLYERITSGQATFKEEVQKWLDALPEETAAPDAELAEFYRQYGDASLDNALYAELRELIVRACTKAGFTEPQPQRVSKLMDKALNNRLERLGFPYRIKADNGVCHFIHTDM